MTHETEVARNTLARQIAGYQQKIRRLEREVEALRENVAALESQLREAAKAGTPYSAERDSLNALILQNAKKDAALSRIRELASECYDPFADPADTSPADQHQWRNGMIVQECDRVIGGGK